MKQQKLEAEKRTVTGKKVKRLRKDGLLPINLYGQKIKSQALMVKRADFERVYKQAGETALVELSIKGEKKTHSVLIHNPQKHPVTDEFLHADFRQVTLTEKMKVEVPIALTGKSPAAEKNIGVLLNLIDKVEVEALPQDIPDEIRVDIGKLTEIGNEIKVKELKSGQKFEITTDENTTVVRINPLQKEEEAEPVEVKEEVKGEEKAEEKTDEKNTDAKQKDKSSGSAQYKPSESENKKAEKPQPNPQQSKGNKE